MRVSVRDLPSRAITGAFILHSGLEKLRIDPDRAKVLQAMASQAYPPIAKMDPVVFARLLAGAEIAVGGALVTPLVPNRLAGASLTAFAGALVGMYLRTPDFHEPGSVWPTPAGTAVAKDAWMLGIGLGLLAGGAARRGSRALGAAARVVGRAAA